ncbi:D-glucuronyl C5-epimerase [Trinorchestia longiramus]|nr:D-glucuronyl C5-epimerase [Trinorchestia longiramus]
MASATAVSGFRNSCVWLLQMLCVAAATVVCGSCNSCVWQLQQLCVAAATAVCGSCNSCVWQLQQLCVAAATAVCGSCNSRLQQLCVAATTAVCGSYNSCVWQLQQLCVAAATAVCGSYNSCVWQLQQLCVAAATAVCGSCNSCVWQLQQLCVAAATAVCGSCNSCYPGVGIVDVAEDEDYAVDRQEDEQHDDPTHHRRPAAARPDAATTVVPVPCLINQVTTVPCRRDDSEVYVPFSFLEQYFEVHGSLQPKSKVLNRSVSVGEEEGSNSAGEVFVWQHSTSKVFEPALPYSPFGAFLNFRLYNVESRDRVKCVSAKDGVPISTQWQSSGHTYPIQIAQFGLAHYCKLIAERKPKRAVLEDGSSITSAWQVAGAGSRIGRVTDTVRKNKVLRYRANECGSTGKPTGGVRITVPASQSSELLTMSLDWFVQPGSSLVVSYVVKDKKQLMFYVRYLPSEDLFWTKPPRSIFYGVGAASGWRHFTRNLLVDLQKGLAALPRISRTLKKVGRSRVQVTSLQLCGEGRLDNLTLSSAEHLDHFYAGAEWLVRHQDHRGGWPITVPRTVVKDVLELDSGWYSAMAQGQAMSLLVRAAHHSGDEAYFTAALRATQLFHVNASQGGVRAYFPGGYAWYEEYPTTPSLFVLNGFIYSLIGLYDLKEARSVTQQPLYWAVWLVRRSLILACAQVGFLRPGPSTADAAELFNTGMTSLKKLLPLFDTGWGSLYDLRHFTSHVPPKPARWDYHTTHITQLLLLASLDDDLMLSSVAARWRQYLNGQRASHN